MSKPSDKKRKKQQTRQKRKAAEKHQAARRRNYIATYPQFVFAEQNDAPEEFVDLIRDATKMVDLRNPTWFSPELTEAWKGYKMFGWSALREFTESPALGTLLTCSLGQTVFNFAPGDQLLKWIPFSDVQFFPADGEISVRFRSLPQCDGNWETIYYSPHKPTLSVDGQQKTIAFSKHAIRRTCERISPNWFTYAGLGDAFAFFNECLHFQRYDLYGGKLAFTFFDCCAEEFFSGRYVEKVLGRQMDGEHRYYYRVGYCPAVIEGDFIKAKTLLFPGYTNTPKFGAVLKSGSSDAERTQLKERATQQTAAVLQETGDFSLLKFFHDAGVPQVIESDEEWYAPPL